MKLFGGDKKSGPLRAPIDIFVDPIKNQFFVTDKENHRVCIFSLLHEGRIQFISSFGSEGEEDGQFDNPWGITGSPNGQLLALTDCYNHRVQIFDRAGHFLRKYSDFLDRKLGVKEVVLSWPKGITFDKSGNNILFERS